MTELASGSGSTRPRPTRSAAISPSSTTIAPTQTFRRIASSAPQLTIRAPITAPRLTSRLSLGIGPFTRFRNMKLEDFAESCAELGSTTGGGRRFESSRSP